ncbi:MAG: hypothetical protein A3B37_02120 [Candidatus Sungbacteria bacterium RIFCSPLOWO2_01_FULL_59_16]|uniref:DUF5666 domain-containing protein n=1 Tax=Candidatus Sungbacteria bacterium RIFCSPLOWO2_01_FULL_59_16 TaxID=1802280 RepID=A0A1G2LCW0_9BACT|nr:MAG: hypothetical protein A3B37_02120 [Candidatus Sungbacteria bacterium RIFCSPLOWO2_01_FULL_59_16]
MNFKDFVQSKTFRGILVGIGVVLIALFIFQAGVFVGYRKASFSYRWGENYHRNFGGPAGGFMRGPVGGDFANPHGTFGRIIKIELPNLTIQEPKDVEKVIVIKSDTIIRRFRDAVKPEDLKVDEHVVVIGSPNDAGQIEAKFIRVMPAPPFPPPQSFSWGAPASL